MRIDTQITPEQLTLSAQRVISLAAEKSLELNKTWDATHGAPVFTAEGKYSTRGWTQWTHGFQFGIPLLVYEVTAQPEFLAIGRRKTLEHMPVHLTHRGVHDHGFNIVSTYGALARLMHKGLIPFNEWELATYQTALKASAAVQAMRWSETAYGHGYIYSFNGPQSLFCDTLRTLRSLALGHGLGHRLHSERDAEISLLDRLVQHIRTTARFNVFFGDGRDIYDHPGRVAHESIFNPADGYYRCPSSQQGYSPFSTWSRGLAWILCGSTELLEWIESRPSGEFDPYGGLEEIRHLLRRMAKVTADYYIDGMTALDGIPFWDDGAPGLVHLEGWRDKNSVPENPWEPVDSSAAAISAQGLIRLGLLLKEDRYLQAGLTAAQTLFAEPYLCTNSSHQGLLLHSVYHRPNGWDHIPANSKIPQGESSMWGDYHLVELSVLILSLHPGSKLYCFFPDE